MRKMLYGLNIFFIILFYFIEKIGFMDMVLYPITIIFLLSILILFSNISIESYKNFIFLKKDKYIYFLSISILISLICLTFLSKNLNFTTFNNFYLYEFRYLKIIIFSFTLYFLRSRQKESRFYLLFAIFLFAILYLIINFYISMYVKYIPIIMFSFIYLICYLTSRLKVKKIILEALEYNIISEITYLLYFNSDKYFLYIGSLFWFFSSLLRVSNYFYKEAKKDYFKNQYCREKRSQKLLELNEKPIILLKGYIVKKANKSALKLFSVNNFGEIRNQNIFNFVSTKDMGGYKLDKSLETGHKNVEIRKKDGSKKRRLAYIYKLSSSEDGEYMLEFSEEANFGKFFYELNDKLENVIYIYEKDIGYQYVSKGIEKLLNYSPEEFYEDKWFTKKISVDNKFENIIKELEEPHAFTAKYKSRDGKVLELKESIRKVNIDEREFYYGIVTDVSEYVSEVELMQNTIKDLLEKNNKKDMAMSIVSHEIRTPITAIIGFLENILINNKNLDLSTGNMIKKVYSNSIRLKELVNNLLDLNKLNAGKLEIYLEKNDLTSLINEVILNNETLLEIKGLICENHLKNSVEIMADSSMLYQIINNILSNSIKYNREKGKIIFSKEENDEEIILKVEDNGIGILDENKEKIFMEYERVKSLKEKGTGLGLPLTKKLIELNNGKIWFDSEVDKGTSFYLLFKKPKN